MSSSDSSRHTSGNVKSLILEKRKDFDPTMDVNARGAVGFTAPHYAGQCGHTG